MNVLISTNVTEEGFDITDCNCVIAFDEIDSLHSYIQMKGRARKKDSTFFQLALNNRHNQQKKEEVESFKGEIAGIEKEICALAHYSRQELKEAYRKSCLLYESRSEFEGAEQPLRVRATGALITHSNCTTILEAYCQSYGFSKAENKPKKVSSRVSELGYRCIIKMPNFAPFSMIEGRIMPRKEEAERSACFEAVRKLLEHQKINRYLHPVQSEELKKLHAQLLLEFADDPEVQKVLAEETR